MKKIVLMSCAFLLAFAGSSLQNNSYTIAASANPKPITMLQDGGPFFHKIYSASSPDGLNWTKDNRVLLEHASVPSAIVTPDGKIRIYYVDASHIPENTNCAESTDNGLTFNPTSFSITNRAGSKALDPCIVRLKDDRYRLFYFAFAGTFSPTESHSIHSAISDDGIHFTEEGEAFSLAGLVDPDVFQVTKKKWLMYVFSGSAGGTVIAKSKNGVTFTFVDVMQPKDWGTTTPVKLDDGTFRLYAFNQPDGQRVASFLSSDGINWTQEPGIRLQADAGQQVTDPYVVRLANGSWKMFYKVSYTFHPPPTND